MGFADIMTSDTAIIIYELFGIGILSMLDIRLYQWHRMDKKETEIQDRYEQHQHLNDLLRNEKRRDE